MDNSKLNYGVTLDDLLSKHRYDQPTFPAERMYPVSSVISMIQEVKEQMQLTESEQAKNQPSDINAGQSHDIDINVGLLNQLQSEFANIIELLGPLGDDVVPVKALDVINEVAQIAEDCFKDINEHLQKPSRQK